MYDFSLIDMITYIHFKVFFQYYSQLNTFCTFQWFSLHLSRNRYRHLYVLRRCHFPLLDKELCMFKQCIVLCCFYFYGWLFYAIVFSIMGQLYNDSIMFRKILYFNSRPYNNFIQKIFKKNTKAVKTGYSSWQCSDK